MCVPWAPLNQRVKTQIQMYNWSLISAFLPTTLLGDSSHSDRLIPACKSLKEMLGAASSFLAAVLSGSGVEFSPVVLILHDKSE